LWFKWSGGNWESPPNDLRTCHYTQNGSIVFRIGDLKYNSPYDKMVKAITSGRNCEIPVYFNFMLTRRRTDLPYHVRLAKRAGSVHRFFSDCDGSITVIPREGMRGSGSPTLSMPPLGPSPP
jgi:hypothetical protein